ncbi:hypothetical protein HOY80DRAFT_950633 [Tuber brumale]|nr:hypothetical protein HOY80DRAFT_950633 [Tuber brumale]
MVHQRPKQIGISIISGGECLGRCIAQNGRLMAASVNRHSIYVFEFDITDDPNGPHPEEGTDAGLTHRERGEEDGEARIIWTWWGRRL